MRVLISPRILVVERWFRGRSRARDKTSSVKPFKNAMREVQEGAARAAVVEVAPDGTDERGKGRRGMYRCGRGGS